MDAQDINFPVYRKYKNNRSYFKIINPNLFEEVQIIGSRKVVKQIVARLLPEMNFVNDLIHSYEQMADEISEAEYLQVRD